MKIIVYINQDAIQIVRKSKKTQECILLPLEPGSILNGVLVKEEEILAQLVAQGKLLRNKPVTLVVDSSNIMMKKLETPPMPVKHLSSVLRGEFEVMDESNYLYDFNLLESSKKGNTLMAVAAQRDFISGYVKLLQRAKIKVEKVDLAINGVIKYVHQSAKLQAESFILNIISQNIMLSILFENGKYQLVNRNRLIHDIGSDAYISELYGKLSSMLQFSHSKKSEFPIQTSYYVGLNQRNLSALSEYMGDGELRIAAFDESDIDTSCFYACCCLPAAKHDLNLYDALQRSTKKPFRIPVNFWRGLFLVVLAAGVAYMYLDWAHRNLLLENQITPLQTYIQSQEVVDAQQAVTDLRQNHLDVDQQIAEYEEVLRQIESGKILTDAVLSTIYSTHPIQSLEYALSGETILINGFSSELEACSDYAEMLRSSGYFATVYYSGYELQWVNEPIPGNEEQTAPVAYYHFTIQVQLAEQEVINE